MHFLNMRMVVLWWIGCFCFPAAAALPLLDSSGGMTCHYIIASTKVAWQRMGGDWSDALDRQYGDVAYASATVDTGQSPQSLEFDVTQLATRWDTGLEPQGAIFIRPPSGAGNGVVNISSRENSDVKLRPTLLVERKDGTRTRLEPVADAHFACPSYTSLGQKETMQVSGERSALLVFPWGASDNNPVRRAVLKVVVTKLYGKTLRLGVFTPSLPGGKGLGNDTIGVAAKYPEDHGLEADPAVLLVERFDRFLWKQAMSSFDEAGHADRVDHSPEEMFEPLDGNALEVTIRKGRSQGLNAHYRFETLGGEPDEAFFRYYLRLGQSWDPSDGGKLPGLSGTYNRAGWGGRKVDGYNGWSARGGFSQAPQKQSKLFDFRGVGNYVYLGAMTDTYGEYWGWNLGPTGMLKKAQWYSIEQQVKLNTPGHSDGELRAWVDGQLVFERTNLRIRETKDLKIESVWFNVYHGGTTPAPKDLTLYIDNIVISKKYIGPKFTGVSASNRALEK